MRKGLLLGVLSLLVLIQCIFADFLKVFGVKPDFILIALFLSYFFLERKVAYLAAMFLGLAKDIFSFSTWKISAIFLYPFYLFLTEWILAKVSIEEDLLRTLIFVCFCILDNLFTFSILFALGIYIPRVICLRIIFVSLIYSAILFYIALRIVRNLVIR